MEDTSDDAITTHEQLSAHAEDVAQEMLGVGWSEAATRLESGELDGTVAQSRLAMVSYLLDR